jgi:carbamoyl-phosphate synthase large subunit
MLERLLAIRKKHGMDVVIPNLDLEIDRFQRIAPELEGAGIHTLLPTPAARRKLSKLGLSKLSGQHALGVLEFPETVAVRSRRDLALAYKRFGTPMILKGVDARAARVYSFEQAEVVWSRFKEDGETTILAQPVVFGEEFGVGLVCDRSGRLIDSVPLKKLVMCERGKTWSAIATPLPMVVDQLAELMAKVGWHGPADVELIRDSTTERMSLIEINPRFPAWIGYAEMIDRNLPRQLVLAALDRPPALPATDRHRHQDSVFMRTAEEVPASAVSMATLINRGEISYGKD